MTGFLHHIANKLFESHSRDMSVVTIVFPNQRAGLYLRQLLKERSGKPVWAPEIIAFRELVQRESKLLVPDTLFLIFELYKVYSKLVPGTESFENFYFWGQMLLRDFDEIDKYLVSAKHLYKDLSRQKELDMTFDFLTDIQKQMISQFWRGFDDKRSTSQEQFLKIWNSLFNVYSEYRNNLVDQGYGYEGQLYRKLAENVDGHTWQFRSDIVWFAGFNALTKAEETIIKHLLAKSPKTEVFWDIDSYYVEDKKQEAGKFIRQYRRDRDFTGTFPPVLPSSLREKPIEVQITGVPQYVGQAKICSQYLQKLLERKPRQDLRRVAVVLADETLLLPVLHSLPETVNSVNITMGFPLIYAPITGLINQLMELHIFSKQINGAPYFHRRNILRIENHPVLAGLRPASRPWTEKERLYWESDALHLSDLYKLIFKNPEGDFVSYLIRILEELSISEGQENVMSHAQIHYFLKHLYRYEELMDENIGIETFRRLFHQLVRMDTIPFTGEPLQGLQIMGVLETRNLDFDHIFVLGMNEESFPGGRNKHSYVPYNLRKAYNLPHYDQQDAIYAYLFYRLLHNSATAMFFYNTEGDDLGGEEMSRFLKQLLFEKPMAVDFQYLQNDASIKESPAITLKHNKASLKVLSDKFIDPSSKSRLSPSAINVYLDCRLKFYYRYIAGLYETDELEDDVDARTLGNLIHHSVEQLYKPFLGQEVHGEDIRKINKKIPEAIHQAFKSMYHIDQDEPFSIEGKNIIAEGVAHKFLSTILEKDEEYAPFYVLGLEELVEGYYTLEDGRKVRTGGNVDRIDRKGELVRIVDFKTGKDTATFDGIDSLFEPSRNRNKAAFQTFYYSILYTPPEIGLDTVPVVFNRNVLFQHENPRFRDKKTGSSVDRIGPYREPFKAAVTQVLNEIFDPATEFSQTDDKTKCQRCPYNVICQRY